MIFSFLFFFFLHRYAATGDANGEPISREEEFEKMERLEKEVLDYPGLVFFFSKIIIIWYLFRFKSNPNLVSGFEARKLPRAFLVLLENLLNKTPSARPSSERVAKAIRDGKVCCRVFNQIGFLIFFGLAWPAGGRCHWKPSTYSSLDGQWYYWWWQWKQWTIGSRQGQVVGITLAHWCIRARRRELAELVEPCVMDSGWT